MKYYLFLFILIASCNHIVEKNQAIIKATLNAHAVSKSLTIKNYKVEDYSEGSDTVLFFVQGHYSNDVAFNDTLRYAKNGDDVMISK